MLFQDAGRQHTEETLKAARAAAVERGIGIAVVATTTGETGAAAARVFEGTGVKVLAVTHNAGFKSAGEVEVKAEHRAEIERLGGVVVTGTMPLRGVGCAIRNKFQGYSDEQVVASALRLFGQGAKVCAEIAAMASDAGLVPGGVDVLAVAGTARGADTAMVVRPAPSNSFFDMKLREFVAKPSDW